MFKSNRCLHAGQSNGTYSQPARSPSRTQAPIARPGAKHTPQGRGVLKEELPQAPKTFAITIDHGLAAAGMTVALSSMAFAAFMVTQNNREARFERNEDFAHVAQHASTKIHLARKPSSTLDNQSIDYNTTASISRPETGLGMHRPRARINETKTLSLAYQDSESYVLTFVHKNMALLKSAHGFYTAKLGTSLPGAGHVLSIERRGQKWVLVTERTVIAETN